MFPSRSVVVLVLCSGGALAGAPADKVFFEAQQQFKSKHFDEAINTATKCTALEPKYANCWKLLGSAYARRAARDNSVADNAMARGAYEQFLSLAAPDDSDVPKVRAVLEATPPASTTREPTSPDAASEGSGLLREGRFDAAIASLEQCTHTTPGFSRCWKLLGSAYARRATRDSSPDDNARARAAYQHFLELAPDDADAPAVRAILGAEVLHSSAAPPPDTEAGRALTAGIQFFKAGSYDAAIASYEKCTKLDPTLNRCWMMLGSAYARRAARDNSAVDNEKAREAYRHFVSAAPEGDEDAAKVRSLLVSAPR